ncbi:surface lipoprotein assembly modifier [Sphingomonas sp. AOB5]|uniref:surface lipoprotein assembly modifier n=1 Tax=Sphingomonas sp. AOB5 TaxID=3034017 RepID=UPI0023F9EC57|nr:surface lipoprotein assembly modifier [Sphingomonas sp. AOB5]MDF7775676.1 surface lipoprotein assembly modifier [Sphingomonas sp. AOB5]
MIAMRAALAFLAALLVPATAGAQALIDQCTAETCKARLTPDQLAGEAQTLILAGRYDEARPLVAALFQVPDKKFEARFLSGMLAAGMGDHATAAEFYKEILSDDPGQTRVRLELGRELLAMGHTASADKQFKIAAQDDDLPEDVARTIRSVRDVIRARRAWRLDIDLGFAPDSNINNATASDTVTILWGGIPLPLTLDQRAKARSGTGQTGSISGGVRMPVADKVSAIVDFDLAGNNYSGSSYDDYQVQAAGGVEFRVLPNASVSIQGVGAQRWYGGQVVSRQTGAKAGFQVRLSDRDQMGVQIDSRRTDALFDPSYDGWQTGAYITYERAIAKSLVISGGGFVRRDSLKAEAYSNTEIGAIAGFGGELPLGITFGLSGSVSRAKFDAAIPLFSYDPRQDWRYTGRATLGNRGWRLLGFSPQISASYSRIDSSIDYYRNDRLRFRFALARYF